MLGSQGHSAIPAETLSCLTPLFPLLAPAFATCFHSYVFFKLTFKTGNVVVGKLENAGQGKEKLPLLGENHYEYLVYKV